MNEVTLFVGSAALVLLLVLWIHNGFARRAARQAVQLALGAEDSRNSNLVAGFNYDAPTTLGDDLTIAPVSSYRLRVVNSRSPKGLSADTPYLLADGRNHIGRNPGPSHDRLANLVTIKEDPAISTTHLAIEINAGGLAVIDQGSRNGSRLNGRLLLPEEAAPLQVGDTVTLGNTTFKLEREGEETRESVIRVRPRYQFEVISGPAQGQKWTLNQDRVCLGRNQESDWRIADHKVSRIHADIRREGDIIRINDRQSAHGLLVNGRKYDSRALEPGDVIKLGDTEIKFDLFYG